MGRVYVDEDLSVEDIKAEFCYTNAEGNSETVSVDTEEEWVEIEDSADNFRVYVNDIPKLIKALQAAYNYHKENSQ